MIVWLLILGLFTYVIVQRSVVNITLTPVWVLWLVMMTPAFVWMGWILVYGENEPIPPALVFIPFFVCPVLYWYLIQWGRPYKPSTLNNSSTAQPGSEPQPPSPERRPLVRPIDKQEESLLHHCFPWSVYYLQNIEYRPQALICKGQLRTSSEVAYKTVRENIEEQFGNRFLIVFQEGLNGKPFFALVPNPQLQTVNKSNTEGSNHLFVAMLSLIATLFTTTLAGVVFAGIPDNRVEVNLSLLTTGLPYSLALMAILGIHEVGHYLAARFHHIRATFPYFIPIPPVNFFPLGTFGAFVQTRSPIPNRKALFDVAIAGPLAGFIIAVPVLFWGLEHSTVVALTKDSGILNFASLQPSLLLPALMSKLALGSKLTVSSAIKLHPVAIAGYLGLVVTAINLTPVGLLDGGHIVHAMFGQRIGAAIGQIARLLVLALFLVQREFLVWAILLFFIPVVDEPALNDVSELDNKRDVWGLLALSLLLLIILPVPQSLTKLLF